MQKKISLLLVLLATGLLLSKVVQAHHSFSQFDRKTQQVLSGEVTRWVFNNPHVWLHMNVTDDNAETILWSFEGSGLVPLLKKGIDGNTIQPGDQITVMFCPLKDGRPGGAMGWIIKADEDEFIRPGDAGCMVNDEGVERWKLWLEQGFTSNIEAEAT